MPTAPSRWLLQLKGFSDGQEDNMENSVYHWWGTVDMKKKRKKKKKVIYYGVQKHHTPHDVTLYNPEVGVWCAVSVHKITGPEFSEVQ